MTGLDFIVHRFNSQGHGRHCQKMHLKKLVLDVFLVVLQLCSN